MRNFGLNSQVLPNYHLEIEKKSSKLDGSIIYFKKRFVLIFSLWEKTLFLSTNPTIRIVDITVLKILRIHVVFLHDLLHELLLYFRKLMNTLIASIRL